MKPINRWLTGGLAVLAVLFMARPAEAGEPLKIDSILIREMPLRQFAELMTRGCGPECRVVVSEGTADKKISFYLNHTNIEETLRAVCASYGLWYKRDRDSRVVHIMSVEEFRSGLNLYAEEAVEVLTIKYPSVVEIGEALKRLYQDRVVWNRPNVKRDDPKHEIDRALERMDLIGDRAESNRGDGRTSGRGSRDEDDDDDDDDDHDSDRATVVTDVGEMVRKQDKAISALRKSLGTIDPSLTGREVRRLGEISNQPGLVYLSAFPASNDLILRSSDPTSLERVKKTATDLDKPRPQVLLEVKVLDVLLDDEHARGVDWLFKTGDVSGASARGINETPGQLVAEPTRRNLIANALGVDPRAAIFRVVTNDIRARVQLLQDNNRITRLATPNLLVADNEASRVFVGTEVRILDELDVEEIRDDEGNPVATNFDPETERRTVGTTLLITPKIHADRTVTIRILQEDSALGQERRIVYGPNGENLVSQDIDERSVTTTVVARDGEIVAIGGLIREQVSRKVVGVPGLHRVPVLGEFFKRTRKKQERHELMILIRPYVLLAPGEGQDVSVALLERISRHPSARKDLPALGVGEAGNLPVGARGERVRNMLKGLKGRARTWESE